MCGDRINHCYRDKIVPTCSLRILQSSTSLTVLCTTKNTVWPSGHVHLQSFISYRSTKDPLTGLLTGRPFRSTKVPQRSCFDIQIHQPLSTVAPPLVPQRSPNDPLTHKDPPAIPQPVPPKDPPWIHLPPAIPQSSTYLLLETGTTSELFEPTYEIPNLPMALHPYRSTRHPLWSDFTEISPRRSPTDPRVKIPDLSCRASMGEGGGIWGMCERES